VIKEQLEKLKEIDAMKEEYFYATSHEFKTPLTTIVSLSKMLLGEKIGKLNEQQREALNLVYHDSKRLRGAVQRILDIARIESGKMTYNIEEIDLNPIFDEILETIKILIDAKNLTVNKKISGKLPKVLVDKVRLALVIENLISNSIKFTPVGGRIDITASKDKDKILVEVHDTGVGIPKEDTEKIFEKYYQVKSGAGGDTGGSGLGLVICKRIVEDFGGRIWVESKLGEGSSFKFTLPYKG
jgi:signal transduction histidine kinase